MNKFIIGIILFILISKQYSYCQITKVGQFTFLKNYNVSGYFAVNDSIIFCNNVLTGKSDVINLFQRKVIKSLDYTITGNNNSLTWDNAQDAVSIYFVGIQNSKNYFIKIRKADFSEVWKIGIEPRPDINLGYPRMRIIFNDSYPFALFNDKIVFFSGGNIFYNKNSSAKVFVEPGLVIYDTSGYMLANKKITNLGRDLNTNQITELTPAGWGGGLPQIINTKNSLIVGFNSGYSGAPWNWEYTVRTDSFDLSPINGPSSVKLKATGVLSDPTGWDSRYGNADYTWTNKNLTGTWTSSNSNVIKITRNCPNLSKYCILNYEAVGLGTTKLTYTFTSEFGKQVSTSMVINVVENTAPINVKQNYCFLEFDQNFSNVNNFFTEGRIQGGYYDAVRDSITIYGTESKVFLSNTSYKSGPAFNFKYSFKNLKDTSFVLDTYTGSAGSGTKCYFNSLGNKQFYYLPFKGSVLYKQPYTSAGNENFLSGLMDNSNRSIIDDSKSVFFRNLTNITASFAKGEKFQFLATDDKDFFTDMRYTNTGLYILAIDNNGIVSPDSLSSKGGCPPPIINYGNSNQICSGGSITLSSDIVVGNQWYRNGVMINGANGQTYLATTPGNYTDTVINTTTGCKSGSAIITLVAVASPAKPIISRDINNNLISSSTAGNQWYSDTSAVIIGQTSQSFRPTMSGYYSVKVTSNNCSSLFSDKYYYLITSLANFNNSQFIRLYPSPVNNELLVDFNIIGQSQVSIKIVDQSGRILIYQNKINKGKKLSVLQLNRGVYYVQVFGKNNQLIFTDKFIKE